MKLAISPGLRRAAGVLVFGALMALRGEMAGHLVRALLAGGALGALAFTSRAVPRPLKLSLHAHCRTGRSR